MESIHVENRIYDLDTLAGIQSALNHLEGIKAKREAEIRLKNLGLFTQEVRDVLTGTGAFSPKDIYGHFDRVRSSIKGIDTIEHPYDNKIIVRLKNRSGMFVPRSIKIEGIRYKVTFEKTGYYSEFIEY